MKLIKNLDEITEPFKNAVITIGNFDGVHIGHQALFHEVIERADSIGGTSIAMTFDPHPLRVLTDNGHPPLITLYEQKAELIEKSGIDVLIRIEFTHQFASLTAKEFIEDILIDRIGMKAMIVGKDYTFGKNREGNIELLQDYAKTHGYKVITANWIQSASNIDGRVSSTKIRELIGAGKVAEAQQSLGRFYQIRGVVAAGRDRGGRLLGFPTANINLQDELCPKSGVYAVTVEFSNKQYKGVANIGYSPTFDDHVFTVEVHILDFDQDIYSSNIRVNFVERIRDEIKFSGVEELSEQIRKDIIKAREILA